MQVYHVTEGDSLWKIAHQAKSNPQQLMALNGLPNDRLQPGLHLVVPSSAPALSQAKPERKTIETNGYIVATGAKSDTEAVTSVGRQLTYVSVFSHQLADNGTLIYPNDRPAIAGAKSVGAQPLLVVSNFDGAKFNADRASLVLNDAQLGNDLILSLVEVANNRGYKGIQVYFLHMHPGDRAAFNTWLEALTAAAHRQKLSVSVALPPKTADNPSSVATGAQDYKSIGQTVDFAVVLSYEWAWPTSAPAAIAPIKGVDAVMKYAVSTMPSGKLMMGAPLYGYSWPLPHPQGGAASAVSSNTAQNLALANGRTIHWDGATETPWYRYRQPNGQVREVWFEDPLSMKSKLQLVYTYNLRGVSFWELSNTFPQSWHLVADNFVVHRRQS